jgi:hypothetical protein
MRAKSQIDFDSKNSYCFPPMEDAIREIPDYTLHGLTAKIGTTVLKEQPAGEQHQIRNAKPCGPSD